MSAVGRASASGGRPSRRDVVLGGVALALAAGCARRGVAGDSLGYSGALIDPPTPRPHLLLRSTDGQSYDFASRTAGRLALLFFGYTSCPDVCPVHLDVLARSLEMIRGPGADADVVFVAVDSERDTAERVRSFLDQFDRDFTGLVGSSGEIDGALREMTLAPVTIGPADPDGSYAVGHPAGIYVFTADDHCHIVYPFGARSENWVRDLPKLAVETWNEADP